MHISKMANKMIKINQFNKKNNYNNTNYKMINFNHNKKYSRILNNLIINI